MITLNNLEYLNKRLEKNESIKIHQPIPFKSIPGVFIVGTVIMEDIEDAPQSLKEVAVREDDKTIPAGEYKGFWLDSFLLHYAFSESV